MKLKSKNVYLLFTLIYIVLTIIELIKYFIFDSTMFGLIYLVINIFIIFMISMVTINYDKAYPIKRISKVLVSCLLGIFASFVLNIIIEGNLSYIIENDFVDKIYLTKNIFKPIIYVLFILMSALEIKVINDKKHGNNVLKSPKYSKNDVDL